MRNFVGEKNATMRKLILISNDDGYQARGIRSLVDMVKDLADVVVCAPEGARSGYSCAFTAATPLTLTKREEQGGVQVWSCSGTPVDCVKMALSEIVTRQPDLVLGGINHGDNGSVNAHYSGTMGVVIEGCMKYIPSVAYSLCDHRPDADFEPLRPLVAQLTRRVLDEGLPQGVCLNVNFPLVERFRGVRVCRMAKGRWIREIEKCRHPRNEYDYYWMAGAYTNDEPDAQDTDNWALTHGYVAITPTQIDLTHYDMLERMKTWDFPAL